MSTLLAHGTMAGRSRVVVAPTFPKVNAPEPSLLERAERLRDSILRSKLSNPNPWHYTGKARVWAQRAQRIVDDIAAGGEAETCQRAFEALATEVEGDADFQEARRLF